MIKFKVSIVGSYPKPISLGKAISRYRSNKISQDKLEEYISKQTQKFFELVKNVNADYTTDGMFRWDDVVDVTFSYLAGAEKGDLMRFYDNNFYYRRPVIRSRLEAKTREYVEHLQASKKLMSESKVSSRLKAVILGPLSYLQFSEDKYYKDPVELMKDYVTETNKVIKEAEKVVDALEIHEPAVFDKGIKGDVLQKVPELYSTLFNGIRAEKHLITYFYVNSRRLDLLFSLPVDVVGLDVIENKNKLGVIYKYFKGKKVFLGVLNTRNTKLERPSTIVNLARKAYEKGVEEVLIGNSAPMDFIPEIIAKRKINLLAKARSMYHG